MSMILSPHKDKILNALQYQGLRNDCGPFTTATVINALLGLNLDATQLSDEMLKPVWRGAIYVVRRVPNWATFPWGMVDIFRSYGLRARWRLFAKTNYIKEALPQGKVLMPIIGAWRPSIWAHVMSLVAWDDDQGWGFANTQHNHQNIDWKANEVVARQWKAMGHLLVEINPY
jgi:hypothetical protein